MLLASPTWVYVHGNPFVIKGMNKERAKKVHFLPIAAWGCRIPRRPMGAYKGVELREASDV